MLELLALPKQALIWAEHWEALPNLEDRGGDLEKSVKISHSAVKSSPLTILFLQLYITPFKAAATPQSDIYLFT